MSNIDAKAANPARRAIQDLLAWSTPKSAARFPNRHHQDAIHESKVHLHGLAPFPDARQEQSARWWEAVSAVVEGSEGLGLWDIVQLFKAFGSTTSNLSRRERSMDDGPLALDRSQWRSLILHPMSRLDVDLHASLVETCVAERVDIPQYAMDVWGESLECLLRSPPVSLVVERRNVRSLCRLLVGFSRLRRRPPHNTMNVMLAAVQPYLPTMPHRYLAACLGALSRLRYVPTSEALSWLAECLKACTARVADFSEKEAIAVIRALVAMETSPWARCVLVLALFLVPLLHDAIIYSHQGHSTLIVVQPNV